MHPNATEDECLQAMNAFLSPVCLPLDSHHVQRYRLALRLHLLLGSQHMQCRSTCKRTIATG